MGNKLSIALLVKMRMKKRDIDADWLMSLQNIKKREVAEKKLKKYVDAGYLYKDGSAYAFRLFPKKEK